ncbi:hypothetical protein ACFSQ7_50445 [Paenibacillus rhizoplanae]
MTFGKISPVHHPNIAENLLLVPDAHGKSGTQTHLHHCGDADRMAGILQIVHNTLFLRRPMITVFGTLFADDGRDSCRITLKLMGAVANHMMIAVLNRNLRLKRFTKGIRQGFHAVKKTVK